MKGKGLLHKYDSKLCPATVILGMDNAPATHDDSNEQVNSKKSKNGQRRDDEAKEHGEG